MPSADALRSQGIMNPAGLAGRITTIAIMATAFSGTHITGITPTGIGRTYG